MPLSLEKCGNLGGDVEMVAVVKQLALRNPGDDFYLLGRNSMEKPQDVGLPSNIHNPWIEWWPMVKEESKRVGIYGQVMTPEVQLKYNDIFMDIIGPTFCEMNSIVMWIGQHGTSNLPLPGIREKGVLTKPQDWCAHYASPLIQGINRWRDQNPLRNEEIYLNSDVRNNLKLRDLKWPLRHPVLTQFNYTHGLQHERYGDLRSHLEIYGWDNQVIQIGSEDPFLWKSQVKNIYARLELNSVMPGTPFGDTFTFNDSPDDRDPFGIFVNETRAYVKNDRLSLMKQWVMPLQPAWVRGTWSEKSAKELGFPSGKMSIKPEHYAKKFQTVRSTFTMPGSGAGWATAKPWEAFAAGVVCFFHPDYDEQNNILAEAPLDLQKWLRVNTPEELAFRVDHLSRHDQDWHDIVVAQRQYYEWACNDAEYLKHIERRMNV